MTNAVDIFFVYDNLKLIISQYVQIGGVREMDSKRVYSFLFKAGVIFILVVGGGFIVILMVALLALLVLFTSWNIYDVLIGRQPFDQRLLINISIIILVVLICVVLFIGIKQERDRLFLWIKGLVRKD